MAGIPMISQITPPVPVQQGSWLSVDSIFWFTILLIFIVTIVSAMLRRLVNDKILKLFHHYHVGFFSETRPAIWGDCMVSSQGLKLLFDKAFVTQRTLVKSSALLYEDELTPMICMTRCVLRLTEHERRKRLRQIERTFHPGALRRARRWSGNMLNTMRDAITKTMSLVIGRMTAVPGSMAGAAISTQAGDLNTLTGSVVNLAANAYEPLLERYIGQPIVVEIQLPNPAGATGSATLVEFPGYLVDYTQKFLAVFNVDQTPVEKLEIKLEPGKAPSPDLADLKITTTDQDTIIQCQGKDAFILVQLACGVHTADLQIAIIPGTTLVLGPLEKPTILTVERTRQIDLIVPRTRARIRYGSLPSRKGSRWNWLRIPSVLEGGNVGKNGKAA
jgi:hypothetical protein